jgi:hypothetical protein
LNAPAERAQRPPAGRPLPDQLHRPVEPRLTSEVGRDRGRSVGIVDLSQLCSGAAAADDAFAATAATNPRAAVAGAVRRRASPGGYSARRRSVHTAPRELDSTAAVMNLTPRAPSSTEGTRRAAGSGARRSSFAVISSAQPV